METNLENIRKPMFWAELPFEIAKGVGNELLRLLDVKEPVAPPARITYLEAEPDDLVA